MDQQLFISYLQEYTLKALAETGDNVPLAADYLDKISKPRFYTKNYQEKKAALERAIKVFSASRERSLYIVLKSLGFDDLAKEKL